MDKWHKLLGSTLAAVAIAASGCSGNSAFRNLFAKNGKPAAPEASVAHSGRGVGHRGPAEKKSISDSIASSWKSMTGKVSDAMTVKPKEEKPADPLSLENDPGPGDPALFVKMAEAYEQKGKFQEAQEQYERALAVAPKHRASLIGIARLHDRQGQFRVAEKHYVRAVKAYPEQADFYNDLGLCLARQKKSDLAVEILKKAVQIDPSKVLYRNNLATVLVDQGNYDEALKQFTAGQDEAVAHYNLGYLLSKRNEHEAAIRHLRIASELNPQFTQAQQMLAKLGGDQPAIATAPTYRISDREVVADYQKPKIPAQLTSGVMLSRLPAIESNESWGLGAESVEQAAATTESSEATGPGASAPATSQSRDAEPEADSEFGDSTASESSFVPAQPEQMSPPSPAK